MAKSSDLYQHCIVCNGTGVSPSALMNKDGVCIICQGERYLPLGLNKSQVDAALRKAGEYDQLAARVAKLEAELKQARIAMIQQGNRLNWNADAHPLMAESINRIRELFGELPEGWVHHKITDIPLRYLHRADASDYEHLNNRPDMRKQDRAKYDDNEDGA